MAKQNSTRGLHSIVNTWIRLLLGDVRANTEERELLVVYVLTGCLRTAICTAPAHVIPIANYYAAIHSGGGNSEVRSSVPIP